MAPFPLPLVFMLPFLSMVPSRPPRSHPGWPDSFFNYGPLLMLTVTFAVYAPAGALAGTVNWKSGV